MKNRFIGLLQFPLLLTLVAFTACTQQKLFEQFQKFDKQSWNRFNILKFDVPVKDTINTFDIIFSIRHFPEFSIKELPINLTIYMPSGEMRTAEHLLIFTDKEGNKLSECLGDLCDISFPVRESFVFPESGTVRIEIENKWSKLDLPGIMEAGLILKRSKN
jgi:gliding motility-associated lipoprotein GldH